MTGMAAGLQAVLELPPGTERSVVQAAADQGLAVQGLAEFRYEAPDTEWQLSRRGRPGGRLRGALRQRVGGRARGALQSSPVI